MSEKSKRDEQSIEDGMRQWHQENLNRAMRLTFDYQERERGVDPEKVVDSHFVQHDVSFTQTALDQQTLADNEARLDWGENVTTDMHRALWAIHQRHQPK